VLVQRNAPHHELKQDNPRDPSPAIDITPANARNGHIAKGASENSNPQIDRTIPLAIFVPSALKWAAPEASA
jgi:hypothetical protein